MLPRNKYVTNFKYHIQGRFNKTTIVTGIFYLFSVSKHKVHISIMGVQVTKNIHPLPVKLN